MYSMQVPANALFAQALTVTANKNVLVKSRAKEIIGVLLEFEMPVHWRVMPRGSRQAAQMKVLTHEMTPISFSTVPTSSLKSSSKHIFPEKSIDGSHGFTRESPPRAKMLYALPCNSRFNSLPALSRKHHHFLQALSRVY